MRKALKLSSLLTTKNLINKIFYSLNGMQICIILYRLVLVLKKLPAYDDYLFCGISTQLHQKIEGFDEIILPTPIHGIRQTSLIRLSFLVALSETRRYKERWEK